MMGCSSSMDTSSINEDHTNDLTHWQHNGMGSVDVVKEFARLDEQISKLEATCPGPRVATAEAWVEHLQAKRDSLLGVEGMTLAHTFSAQQRQYLEQQANGEVLTLPAYNALPGSTVTATPSAGAVAVTRRNGFLPHGNGATNRVGVARHTNDIAASTPNRDLANLAISLGVIGDVNKASTHEDFFANLSESALYLTSIRYYAEILEHTKVRLKALTDSYTELNELYVNHDSIIAYISGGTYVTRLEESIDAQLETARDIRDKLGSTLEQWRICGLLLRACANAATQSLQQWRQLTNIVNPKDKVQAALACRDTLQASLISLDCAQQSLPHVEIKYVSHRQTLAVNHCNTYMITDIANLSRYEHTTKVLTTYESNMSKASTWLYETFNKTLRKDFNRAEETVRNLAKTLRDHREEIFSAARK